MSAGSHLDDEQLTALDDGDGTADERAHLASCARCAERAEALSSVAALVAAPPPPPSDDAREAAVVAALEAAGRPTQVRHRPRRGMPAWALPAAAAVAFFAVVAALIPLLEDRSSDDDTSRQASGAAESSGDDSTAGTVDQRLQGAPPAGAPDLGVVDDEAELARRVDEALGSAASADAGAEASTPERCVASFRTAGTVLGPVRLRASLTWRGQPAQVLSDGDRAYVVAAGGCTTLAVVDLP